MFDTVAFCDFVQYIIKWSIKYHNNFIFDFAIKLTKLESYIIKLAIRYNNAYVLYNYDNKINVNKATYEKYYTEHNKKIMCPFIKIFLDKKCNKK